MTTDKQRIAEETAKEIHQLYGAHYGADREIWERTEDLISALILRALEQAEQGWVSVSERLPDDGKAVHVLLDSKTLGIGERFCEDEGWCWSLCQDSTFTLPEDKLADFQMDDLNVTHWRPLPLPAPPVHPERAQEVTNG